MIKANTYFLQWLVWCCLFGWGRLLAQSIPGHIRTHNPEIELEAPRLNFGHLTKEDGFPEDDIFNVFADREGYLWVCSNGSGLMRYDGYNFTVYKPDPLDSTAFPTSIFYETPIYDMKGRLWFSTDVGLVRYDAATDNFRTFSYLKDGKSSPVVFCTVDKKGNFWLLLESEITVKRLCRFNPVLEKFYPYDLTNKVATTVFGKTKTLPLYDLVLTNLTRENNGELWLWNAKANVGLLHFDPNVDSWTYYPYPTLYELNDRKDILIQSVLRLLPDEDGKWIWIFNWNNGIYGFNRSTLEWHIVNIPTIFLDGISWNQNELLLTSYNEGVWVLNKNNFKVHQYYTSCETPTYAGPLAGRLNQIVKQDSTGILFFVGEKGLSVINPFLQNLTKRQPLPVGEVSCFYTDTLSGKVLALTEDYKLCEWNEINNSMRCVELTDNFRLESAMSGFTKDAFDKYWLGASMWVDPVTLQITPFDRPIENTTLTLKDFSFWIPLPMPNGDMWFCSRLPRGILHFDYQKESFQWHDLITKTNQVAPETRRALPAGDNKLWIATNQGLVFFDTKSLYARFFTLIPGDSTSIPQNFVADIAFDKKGQLWACTSNGLCRYEPSSSTFIRIKGSEYVFTRMVIDKRGDIWAKANEGLYHFQPATNRGRLYTESDGLHVDMFERIGLSPKGAIMLGNSHYFFPDEVVENTRPPKVVFTGFKVFDKNYPLARPIDFTSEIELQYKDNFFAIEFAGLNFTQPELNRYRWQLQGIDPNWVEGGNRHRASYTNLPPGSYTFLVTAANNDGYWNPQPRKIFIHILPAWWQAIWFKALVLALVILLALAFYRNHIARIRAKEETQRKEAELAMEKSKFEQRITEMEMKALRAQMNPHFLFNVLMSINRFMLENDMQSASTYLTRFSRLIRLVLENSKLDKVTLANELEALRLYIELEALRFKEKVRYKFDIGPEVDIQYIQIPPLLLQPFVENAIWHGLMHKDEGGTVFIRIQQPDDNLLHVEIEDDGIGRARATELKSKSATQHKSFGLQLTEDRFHLINRLYQMENRVQVFDLTDVDGEPSGTKVILEIPV